MVKQCTCIICENREIERLSAAMSCPPCNNKCNQGRNCPARCNTDIPPMWVGAVIIAAFAVWVVAMIVKTGVVL